MDESLTSKPQPLGWLTGPGLHFLVAATVWILATSPAWWSMAGDWWNDPNYSHGWLVIPVACFFAWSSRHAWSTAEPRASLAGMMLFIGCAILYLVGTAAAENFSVRVAAIGGIGSLVWAVLGWRIVRLLWFPLMFLLFAVPWPYVVYYQVTGPLQLLSTKATCAILDLLGMSFVRQGNIIHLPGYSLEVVEACSGVRSLLSLTALGAAYAYFTQPGIVRPLVLFLLSFPIALVANVMRLGITAVGAYVWDPRIAESFLHEVSGLVVFAISLVALMLTGSFLTWINPKP